MDILAKVEANKKTCSTGSKARDSAIDIELFIVKTGQHLISPTFWFGWFFHLQHWSNAIYSYLKQMVSNFIVFVVFGFLCVLVEIGQSYAW